MVITEHTTVGEIAAAIPSSVRVFQRHNIDFCCGGRTPLGVACRERGVSFAEVAGAVEEASAPASPDDRDWSREPLRLLIDHIVGTYHKPLRDELPRLEAISTKVAGVHGAKAPHLSRVKALVSALSGDLTLHMQKEERMLFPAIRAIEDDPQLVIPINAPINVMEQEHDGAGEMLSELRAITGGYVAPPWACGTFRALYQGLAELESDMHVHVHLENNVLFPRAMDLTRGGAQG
jgi:regulator of cell morphogenesis and NO signaling